MNNKVIAMPKEKSIEARQKENAINTLEMSNSVIAKVDGFLNKLDSCKTTDEKASWLKEVNDYLMFGTKNLSVAINMLNELSTEHQETIDRTITYMRKNGWEVPNTPTISGGKPANHNVTFGASDPRFTTEGSSAEKTFQFEMPLNNLIQGNQDLSAVTIVTSDGSPSDYAVKLALSKSTLPFNTDRETRYNSNVATWQPGGNLFESARTKLANIPNFVNFCLTLQRTNTDIDNLVPFPVSENKPANHNATFGASDPRFTTEGSFQDLLTAQAEEQTSYKYPDFSWQTALRKLGNLLLPSRIFAEDLSEYRKTLANNNPMYRNDGKPSDLAVIQVLERKILPEGEEYNRDKAEWTPGGQNFEKMRDTIAELTNRHNSAKMELTNPKQLKKLQNILHLFEGKPANHKNFTDEWEASGTGPMKNTSWMKPDIAAEIRNIAQQAGKEGQSHPYPALASLKKLLNVSIANPKAQFFSPEPIKAPSFLDKVAVRFANLFGVKANTERRYQFGDSAIGPNSVDVDDFRPDGKPNDNYVEKFIASSIALDKRAYPGYDSTKPEWQAGGDKFEKVRNSPYIPKL